MLTLAVEKRAKADAKASAVRRAGKVPAVVYGPHQVTTPIAVEARSFSKVFSQAGESSIVALTGLDGEDLPTLIHAVDFDPLTHEPHHIDFYAVTKGEKVEVDIPLEFTGESPAVKAGANLVKVLYELTVEADPMSLPHSIDVDLSVLAQIGDRIQVKDLALPEGVTLQTEPNEVVALVQEVVEEKEDTGPADLSSIEVEEKGKEAPAEGDAPAEAS